MLCVTKMSNPWTVESTLAERSIISTPNNPWEKTPYNRTVNVRLSSNEGPEQLINPRTNQTFVIYSAARSDNRDYCLGQLELIGADPMNPSDWRKDDSYCVFYQNPDAQSYGVGHASFTTSPDGTQDWIVYHGMKDYENGWADRTIRTQVFSWNEDGTPMFPRPGYGPYEVPSGQQQQDVPKSLETATATAMASATGSVTTTVSSSVAAGGSVVSQISDGQPQAPTLASQISDGQPQVSTAST